MSAYDTRNAQKIPQVASIAASLTPLGYQQITATGSAFTLTPPTNARQARIGAEAQVVRWRDDGTNPTASTGQRLAAGTEMDYVGKLAGIKLVAETAGAIVNVSYYG